MGETCINCFLNRSIGVLTCCIVMLFDAAADKKNSVEYASFLAAVPREPAKRLRSLHDVGLRIRKVQQAATKFRVGSGDCILFILVYIWRSPRTCL